MLFLHLFEDWLFIFLSNVSCAGHFPASFCWINSTKAYSPVYSWHSSLILEAAMRISGESARCCIKPAICDGGSNFIAWMAIPQQIWCKHLGILGDDSRWFRHSNAVWSNSLFSKECINICASAKAETVLPQKQEPPRSPKREGFPQVWGSNKVQKIGAISAIKWVPRAALRPLLTARRMLRSCSGIIPTPTNGTPKHMLVWTVPGSWRTKWKEAQPKQWHKYYVSLSSVRPFGCTNYLFLHFARILMASITHDHAGVCTKAEFNPEKNGIWQSNFH